MSDSMPEASDSIQEEFPLVHLLDLVSKEPIISDISQGSSTERPNYWTINHRLHPDDANVLETLKAEDVQSWCLSRIAEYQAPITIVRTQPDLALYSASLHEFVVRHKFHIWALRSAYNDAAPLHRYLPPEILLQIFAHLDHDGTRQGPSALRVCRYWHALLKRTPQLWQSFLSREFLANEDSPWKTKRFAEALSRSAPLDLSLRLLSLSHAIVDVLAPYSRRLASVELLIVGYSYELEPLNRFLQLAMPILRNLELRRWPYPARSAGAVASPIFRFPYLQTLRLSTTILVPPETPHFSLRHLELVNCWDPVVASSNLSTSLRTLLTVIRNYPNLETFRVVGKLSQDTWVGIGSPVNVSRLRHLTLHIRPSDAILPFLSYLVLPLTTVLNIEPVLMLAELQLPLSTSMVTHLSKPPVAEVSLSVKSTPVKNSATWETQGDGSRPLRLSSTYYHNHCLPDVLIGRTNEVLAIFAPGTKVTSLTLTSGSYLRPDNFWTGLLAALPHLARLEVAAGRAGDYPRILPLLGKPQKGGGCLCPTLTDLSVLWDPERDSTERTSKLDARRRLQTTTGFAGVGPGDESWIVTAGVWDYCRVLKDCLHSRMEHGCLSLQALSVSIWDRGYGTAVEAALREGLKDLAAEVSVGFQSEQGW